MIGDGALGEGTTEVFCLYTSEMSQGTTEARSWKGQEAFVNSCSMHAELDVSI